MKAATHKISSKCSVVTKVKYFLLFATTTHRVAKISYPVCAKHRMIGAIATKLSQRNLLNLGFGVLACFFIYGICVALYQSIVLGKIIVSTEFLMFEIMYILTYFGLYYWSKHNTPVKITNATENEIELLFSNEQYSKDFIKLNGEVQS
jgi:hypothetical protein